MCHFDKLSCIEYKNSFLIFLISSVGYIQCNNSCFHIIKILILDTKNIVKEKRLNLNWKTAKKVYIEDSIYVQHINSSVAIGRAQYRGNGNCPLLPILFNMKYQIYTHLLHHIGAGMRL